jgi:hypothetical protein
MAPERIIETIITTVALDLLITNLRLFAAQRPER